jgi:predicted ATPase
VCFDDADVDEATLQANLDAEYEMLSEPEDELFADVAD